MIHLVTEKPKGSSAEHEALIDEILGTFGHGPNLRIWKNSTGAARAHGRYLRWGLKGSADIIGIGFGGRFIAIECKTGQSRQKEHQRNFQNMVTSLGGIYIVARSVDDVRAMINTYS